MIKNLKIKGINWIDGFDLEKKDIYSILKEHDFHELDIEACMEENQRARIDSYDDYLFLVLHFPKYNQESKMYELNEFNVFLRKDLLITFRNFPGKHIDEIFAKYEKQNFDNNEEFKINSGYILYEIVEIMLEKMFKTITSIRRDLKQIEQSVFEGTNQNLVKEIMTKKRNIISLKHMFLPQISVMNNLELNINKLFKGEIEEYFEDLEDKLGYVVNNIKLLEEYISSIEDAFKSIVDMNINNVMKILTLFSAFILPLTLITSFYGMNIDLPMQNTPIFVFVSLFISIIIMTILYIYMRRVGKF